MATNTAVFAPNMTDDLVLYGSASGLATATKGDYMIASAYWVLAANSGTIGTPAYKTSGMGVAIEQNPFYDELGVARSQSALTILRRGIIRVTGISGASAAFPIWTPVFPATTGSGIVGQTGATGIGAIWCTAPMQQISGNPTGALASGVGHLLKVIADGATGQWDVVLEPTRPDYY